MLSALFGSGCTLDINLIPVEGRAKIPVEIDGTDQVLCIFSNGEDVSGNAFVKLVNGKSLEHFGIKVELIGQIECLNDRAYSYDFFSIAKDMEPPGVLFENKKYFWKFSSADMPHDSYYGINVKLHYFVRLSVAKQYGTSVSEESSFIVQNLSLPPSINNTIKMEVGIEDCLQMEFEYDKAIYHLKDVIIGKVYFLLVAINIKYMEISIQRTENVSIGRSTITESIYKNNFEIMDGSPIKGQCIPVRLYLAGLNLSPSYKNVQNKFTIQHYINLTLVDDDGKRYFKKQEITLWRKEYG